MIDQSEEERSWCENLRPFDHEEERLCARLKHGQKVVEEVESDCGHVRKEEVVLVLPEGNPERQDDYRDGCDGCEGVRGRELTELQPEQIQSHEFKPPRS